MKKVFFLLGAVFVILISSQILKQYNSNYNPNTLISIINAHAEDGEGWNDKTHDCIDSCECMRSVIFSHKANFGYVQGTMLEAGWETTEIELAGLRTECTSGNTVAHCWDCTGKECVVPNDVIIAALKALNGK